MSKEATGQSGAKIGSSEYWSRINHTTMLGGLMGSKTSYQATIGQLGTKAAAAIEEIYEDLSALGSKIRYLPSSDRNALAKQVEGLYDICKMGGVSVRHNSECIQGLNLSIMSPWTSSFRDERGIEKAISFIDKSRFSGSEAMKLLQEASKWSISFAAGGNKEKQAFLETAAQGNLSSRFLKDVADEYQNRHTTQRYEGRCGYSVGSKAYMTHLESKVFGAGLPMLICAASGNPDYEKLIKDALNSVADQLGRDLDNAIRENDYIKDETANKLKAVVSELDHCGASTGGLTGKIEKLAWFVGGDPFKIRRLQQALNKLGYMLTEDGVFGSKTLQAINSVHEDLVAGAFPTVVWIDPLQSKITDIHYKRIESKGEWYASLYDTSSRSKNKKQDITVFRADIDETLGPHINTVEGRSIKSEKYIPDTKRQKDFINKVNHTKIKEPTYRWLKNFDTNLKTVRVWGGRILVVGGILLEALELIEAIHIDTHDADKKIGKTTYSSLANLGGSWSLGALGAKGGAMLGASIGTAILPGVGTAIGGAVGSLVLGITGSYSGSKLGEYVIDITMTE